MSFTKLAEEVRALSDEDRLKLRNLLEQIRMENDADWQRTMAGRNAAMDRGEKASLETLEHLHEDSSSRGDRCPGIGSPRT